MPNPWIGPKNLFISATDAIKNAQEQAKNATDALDAQTYNPDSTTALQSVLDSIKSKFNPELSSDQTQDLGTTSSPGLDGETNTVTTTQDTLQPGETYIPQPVDDRGGGLQGKIGKIVAGGLVGTAAPTLRIAHDLLSGQGLVSDVTGGNVDTNNLPGPLPQVADVGLSGLTLGTLGAGALESGATGLARTAASIGAGTVAQQQVEQHLPEDLPEPIAKPLEYGAGFLAGGAAHELAIPSIKAISRAAGGVDTSGGMMPKVFKPSPVPAGASMQFSNGPLNDLMGELGHFPTRAEIVAKASSLPEESRAELDQAAQYYDQIKQIHDAANESEVTLPEKLTDFPQGSTRPMGTPLVTSITPEEAAPLQGNSNPFSSKSDIELKGALINAQGAVDSMEERGLDKSSPGTTEYNNYITQRRNLSLLNEEASNRGLDTTPTQWNRPPQAPPETPTEPQPAIPAEPPEPTLASTPVSELQAKLARLGSSGLPESDKSLLRNEIQKAIDAQGESQPTPINTPQLLHTPDEVAANSASPTFDDRIQETLDKDKPPVSDGLVRLHGPNDTYFDVPQSIADMPIGPERNIAVAKWQIDSTNKPTQIGSPQNESISPSEEGAISPQVYNPSKWNQALKRVNTLADFAVGRLAHTAGLSDPRTFANSIGDALHGTDHVVQLHSDIDAIATHSAGITPTIDQLRNEAGIEIPDPTRPSVTSKIPVMGKAVGGVINFQRNFMAALRPQMAIQEQLDRGLDWSTMTDEQKKDLGKSINLLTGRSTYSWAHGSQANFLIMFPNWLAAQGELILSAAERGTITGENSRQMLLRLVALGTLSTAAINEIQQATGGKSLKDIGAILNTRGGVPQAKIPDIPGVSSGLKWDLYGPLGEVVSKAVTIGQAGVQKGPGLNGGALGATGQAARGYLAPLPAIATTAMTGTDLVGNQVKDRSQWIHNLIQQLAPFNAGGMIEGRQPGADILGSIGERVHQKSPMNQALYDAGITPDSPNYLLDRKEYLAKHPEIRPDTAAANVQKDIASRRNDLDASAATDQTSLANFRDQRTKLLQEQRDKLGTLLGDAGGTISGGGQQGQWLSDYNNLFQKDSNPKTKQINADQLDADIADWSAKNPGALSFVQKYLSTGLGPVETQYYKDIQQLGNDNYFHMERYQNMKSGLSDKQIEDARSKVESVRTSTHVPASRPFSADAEQVLKGKFTPQEIQDIINSSKQGFTNKAYQAYKDSHRQQLLWFDPKAYWSTYQATSNPKPIPKIH